MELNKIKKTLLVFAFFFALKNSPDPDPHLSKRIRIRAAFLNAEPKHCAEQDTGTVFEMF